MKDFFLSDQEIQALIDEPKRINSPVDFILKSMKSNLPGFSSLLQNSHRFPRNLGKGEWSIYVRGNEDNPLDFSCGLRFISENKKQVFSLRRYNGKSHRHTNSLDNGLPFFDFHIHQATERYQNSRFKDDSYAQPTDLYNDFRGAFELLLFQCNVSYGRRYAGAGRIFQ